MTTLHYFNPITGDSFAHYKLCSKHKRLTKLTCAMCEYKDDKTCKHTFTTLEVNKETYALFTYRDHGKIKLMNTINLEELTPSALAIVLTSLKALV